MQLAPLGKGHREGKAMPSPEETAMARNPKVQPNIGLSSDERVVLETHPHESRWLLRRAVVSILLTCGYVGLLAFVWFGRPAFSGIPYLSTALNLAYEHVFEVEWGGYAMLLAYIFTILVYFGYSLAASRMVYFATNKRIIWWNKHSGKVRHSVPLTSVKMVRLGPVKGTKQRRYGDIVFSSDITTWRTMNAWASIPEPESVLRKLQTMTPEPDRGFVRKHRVIGWTVALIGLGVFFLAGFMLYDYYTSAEYEVMIIPGVLLLAGLSLYILGFGYMLKGGLARPP